MLTRCENINIFKSWGFLTPTLKVTKKKNRFHFFNFTYKRKTNKATAA